MLTRLLDPKSLICCQHHSIPLEDYDPVIGEVPFIFSHLNDLHPPKLQENSS